MKNYLIIGLLFFSAVLFAQESPNDVKRYDFKDVGKYDGAKYTVLVITDCVTNEKEFGLKISYSDDKYGDEVFYYRDGIVRELINTFYYLSNTQFGPELKDEKSFIIGEVCDGLFFQLKPDARHIDLYIRNHRKENHLLAGINDDEIEEYGLLLFEIEKTFAEKGRELKDAIILDEKSDEDRKEILLYL